MSRSYKMYGPHVFSFHTTTRHYESSKHALNLNSFFLPTEEIRTRNRLIFVFELDEIETQQNKFHSRFHRSPLNRGGWLLLRAEPPAKKTLSIIFLKADFCSFSNFKRIEVFFSQELKYLAGNWVRWNCRLSFGKRYTILRTILVGFFFP